MSLKEKHPGVWESLLNCLESSQYLQIYFLWYLKQCHFPVNYIFSRLQMGRGAHRARWGPGGQGGHCRSWVAPLLGEITAAGGTRYQAETPAGRNSLAWPVLVAEFGCPALLPWDHPTESEKGAGADFGHRPRCRLVSGSGSSRLLACHDATPPRGDLFSRRKKREMAAQSDAVK